jgi:hypothetical protein
MRRERQKASWYDLLLKFIAANPKMSAAIAFQLGVLAAEAAKGAERSYRELRRHGIGSASSKLLESLPGLPSLNELKDYVGATPRGRRRVAGIKAAATKSQRARKAAATRANRRRKAAAPKRTRKRRSPPKVTSPALAAAA